jgi:glycosyltransferase involved in cell wall biosynthesis
MLEAMACGKAIVSTNVNGIPEAITNNIDGLLSEPHNPEKLAKNITYLLTSSAAKSELEKNSRQNIIINFSHAIFNAKILLLYNNILLK